MTGIPVSSLAIEQVPSPVLGVENLRLVHNFACITKPVTFLLFSQLFFEDFRP